MEYRGVLRTGGRGIGVLLGGVLAVVGGCTSRQQPTAPAAPPTPQSTASTANAPLRLERVVMLMRHGVRTPTKAKVTPDGVADQAWPKWTVDFGELTRHGYDAVKLVGAWDRANWAARGLLPADGCPGKGELAVFASSKSRTQDTARALVEGMAPGCTIDITFPKKASADYEFHTLDTGIMQIDGDEALRDAQARLPAGGMAAEVQRHAALFALLNRALGCCSEAFCKAEGKPAKCDISQMPAGLERDDDGGVSVGDPFGLASTVAQTFLLEYLEGMPMQDVAWGRLTRDEIGKLLEFHAFKYYYEARTPYLAARTASMLAAHMLESMQHGPKLTVLVGHDTDIAELGGLLDLHWTVPGYPKDDPPPAGALGFEVLSDAAGTDYVRAFYRSQTMDQVRDLQPLDAGNAPAYLYLPIPDCAEPCKLQDFARNVRAKLVAPKTPVPATTASAEATTTG
jgi:4-phytase/acid phosphatase